MIIDDKGLKLGTINESDQILWFQAKYFTCVATFAAALIRACCLWAVASQTRIRRAQINARLTVSPAKANITETLVFGGRCLHTLSIPVACIQLTRVHQHLAPGARPPIQTAARVASLSLGTLSPVQTRTRAAKVNIQLTVGPCVAERAQAVVASWRDPLTCGAIATRTRVTRVDTGLALTACEAGQAVAGVAASAIVRANTIVLAGVLLNARVQVDFAAGSCVVGGTQTAIGANQLATVAVDARVRIAVVDLTLTVWTTVANLACAAVAIGAVDLRCLIV